MKNMLFLLVLLVCVELSWAQEPLKADAGKDTALCNSLSTPIYVGGNPSANGGQEPYIYRWYIQPITITSSLSLHASTFLEDTTKANPLLMEFPLSGTGPLVLYLEITDSLLNKDIDTVQIYVGTAVVWDEFINVQVSLGDTVELHPLFFELQYPIVSYTWGPLNATFVSSVNDPYVSLIVDNFSIVDEIHVNVIDSIGCTYLFEPYQILELIPQGISHINLNKASCAQLFKGYYWSVKNNCAKKIGINVYDISGSLIESVSIPAFSTKELKLYYSQVPPIIQITP